MIRVVKHGTNLHVRELFSMLKVLFENTESNQKFLKHLLKHSPVCTKLICPNTLRFQFGNCLGSVNKGKTKAIEIIKSLSN